MVGKEPDIKWSEALCRWIEESQTAWDPVPKGTFAWVDNAMDVGNVSNSNQLDGGGKKSQI